MNMRKKMLGIDIGTGTIKIVDDHQCICIDTPDHVFDEDRFIAFDGMSSLLKETIKEYGLKTKKCAFVIPDQEIYFTKTTMPMMNEKQLMVNLPYELSSVIGKEKDAYIYDYSLIRYINDATGTPQEMELLVGAVKKERMELYQDMMQKAGLKLVRAIPRKIAISQMLTQSKGDIAIADIGYYHTSIDMYHDGVFETGRVIEVGISSMVQVASELLFCDSHIALEYLKNNKDNIWSHQKMKDVNDYIAIEIKRAINYYTYENRDNTLDTLYYFGGGYHYELLIDAIKDAVDLEVKPMSDDEDILNGLLAYGVIEGK